MLKGNELENAVEILKNHIEIRLIKEKQYDFFVCKEIDVFLIMVGCEKSYITKEDFEELQKLDIQTIIHK